jgi:membrane protease YdiL (CAAX protease family)
MLRPMDLGPRAGSFTPYGPWSTIALAAAVMFGSAMVAWMVLQAAGAAPATDALDDAAFAYDILGNLIVIAAIVKLADLRAPGQAARYLALRRFDREAAWRWLGIAAALFLSQGMIQTVLRGVLDMPYEANALDNASPGVPMVLALVLVGPVAEEIMFRGFVMEGLMPTRIGQSGALALSALAWALLHIQYDMISMILVFALGILCGLARLASGSLLLPILLHALWNGFSLLSRFA